jgi:hypothetical protein
MIRVTLSTVVTAVLLHQGTASAQLCTRREPQTLNCNDTNSNGEIICSQSITVRACPEWPLYNSGITCGCPDPPVKCCSQHYDSAGAMTCGEFCTGCQVPANKRASTQDKSDRVAAVVIMAGNSRAAQADHAAPAREAKATLRAKVGTPQ